MNFKYNTVKETPADIKEAIRREYADKTNHELSVEYDCAPVIMKRIKERYGLLKSPETYIRGQQFNGSKSRPNAFYDAPDRKPITEFQFFRSIYKTYRLNPDLTLNELAKIHGTTITLVRKATTQGLNDKWHVRQNVVLKNPPRSEKSK